MMDERLKKELWQMSNALENRPTKFVGTRQLREQLKEVLDNSEVQNTLILNHGQPRAVVLDYETYELMLRMIRKVTLQLSDVSSEELTDEQFEALLAEREAQRPKQRKKQKV